MAGGSKFGWSDRVVYQREVITHIWADAELQVIARRGGLAREAVVGSNLCDAVLPLMGLEDQLQDLRAVPGSAVEVPNVSVVSPGGDTPLRLNYVILWDDEASHFLCTIMRALSANEISIELQRQVRRRMLAEEQLVEQAQAIEAANVTLNRMNRELADFARIVSHDLKSPMRAMRYFAEDLEQSLTAPDADNDPTAHLERLKAQSRRMSSMLSGLLAYVRLEDKSDAEDDVDTRELIGAIVASLPRPETFEVIIEGEWPTIRTNEAPLDLVLRNLIDNAIKHHDREDGRVVASCEARENALHITVADDGPGIDTRAQDAIFLPYARADHAKRDGDSAGPGMGLTLVKRAVEVCGAELSLRSDPGNARGTTLILLWPLKNLT